MDCKKRLASPSTKEGAFERLQKKLKLKLEFPLAAHYGM